MAGRAPEITFEYLKEKAEAIADETRRQIAEVLFETYIHDETPMTSKEIGDFFGQSTGEISIVIRALRPELESIGIDLLTYSFKPNADHLITQHEVRVHDPDIDNLEKIPENLAKVLKYNPDKLQGRNSLKYRLALFLAQKVIESSGPMSARDITNELGESSVNRVSRLMKSIDNMFTGLGIEIISHENYHGDWKRAYEMRWIP